MRYFLGVDIGGTKSLAVIADETGHIIGSGKAGTGNPESVGYDGLTAVLHNIVGSALKRASITKDQITGMGLGVAGYDWPTDRDPTRRAIASLDICAPYEFVNDAVIGLIAGASEGWGISVVSGTSCNCCGRDRQGREGRVTGDGSRMGEYGGGGELVAEAIKAIAYAWTQRGPHTALTDQFIKVVGALNVVDFLEGVVRGRYVLKATDAPLVFEVASGGDAVAQRLITWISGELGDLAVGVIHQLEFEDLDFEVVLAGNFFKGGPLIQLTLMETIHSIAPGAYVVNLEAPPVVGAVMLGMEKADIPIVSVRHKLIESAAQLEAIRD